MNPFGATIDRVVYRASAALPAAGALTADPWFDLPKGTTRVTYWITYTRGAADGYAVFRPYYSNGTEEARELIQDDTSLTVTQPEGAVDTVLQVLNGPAPADGDPITFAYTFERFPAATRRVRLLAAELGVVGTPGTLAIALTADVEPDSASSRAR